MSDDLKAWKEWYEAATFREERDVGEPCNNCGVHFYNRRLSCGHWGCSVCDWRDRFEDDACGAADCDAWEDAK